MNNRIKRFLEDRESKSERAQGDQEGSAWVGDQEKGRIHRAEELVKLDHLSRAAKLLRTNDELAPPSHELADRLREKFPSPRTHISGLNPVSPDAPRWMPDAKQFADLMKKTFNGASGGPTGITGDHIKEVFHFPGVRKELHRMFLLLINGEFPLWMHPYICSQSLIALGEKERPVCIAEWTMRTASQLCEAKVSQEDTKDFFLHQGEHEGTKFRVLQFGNAVKGGIEAALLEAEGLTKIDMNAIISKDG